MLPWWHGGTSRITRRSMRAAAGGCSRASTASMSTSGLDGTGRQPKWNFRRLIGHLRRDEDGPKAHWRAWLARRDTMPRGSSMALIRCSGQGTGSRVVPRGGPLPTARCEVFHIEAGTRHANSMTNPVGCPPQRVARTHHRELCCSCEDPAQRSCRATRVCWRSRVAALRGTD